MGALRKSRHASDPSAFLERSLIDGPTRPRLSVREFNNLDTDAIVFVFFIVFSREVISPEAPIPINQSALLQKGEGKC